MKERRPTIASKDGGGASPVNRDAIRKHYEQFSWAYRLVWGDHLHHGLFRDGQPSPRKAQEDLLRHCAERAGLRPGSRIVDVGCGLGGTARFFAREYSCSVLGLTISETQLRIARRLSRSLPGPGSVRFELADAEAYAFPASSFDLVWNMESLGHFFHKAEYFAKVAAALTTGGRFLLADWAGSMEDPLVREITEAFLCPELLTAQQYSEELQRAGMSVVRCETLARQVAPTWDICAARLRGIGWLLPLLPQSFRAFPKAVELMRRGFRTCQLDYIVLVAEKPSGPQSSSVG